MIPARGGSKGILKKNIVPIGDKTLLEYAVSVAWQSELFDDVIVSTDSTEIRELAIQYGARAPFLRPAELALDETPAYPVVQHCLKWLLETESKDFETLMLLQPTCPFRTVIDLRSAFRILDETPEADAVVSLCRFEEPHPHKMKVLDGKFIRNFISEIPIEKPLRRQALPEVYALNGGIYLVDVRSMLLRKSLLGPFTTYYVMPWQRSINIDTEADLFMARSLASRRGAGQAENE